MLLALGASRWEAASDVICRSMEVSMTPMLNQMSVVGLVSIPGMMTGQVGGSPLRAATGAMCIANCMADCMADFASAMAFHMALAPCITAPAISIGASVSASVSPAQQAR